MPEFNYIIIIIIHCSLFLAKTGTILFVFPLGHESDRVFVVLPSSHSGWMDGVETDPMKNVRMHSRASIKAALYNIYTRRQKRARDAEGRMEAVYSALHIVSLLWAFGFIDRSIDRSSATALHSFIGIILWYDHYPCSDKMLPSIQPRLSRAPSRSEGAYKRLLGLLRHSWPLPVRSLLCSYIRTHIIL